MDNIFKYANGFLGGMLGLLMAVLPVTILWTVLTGGTVFGLDAIAGLTSLVDAFGNGGFTGLVVMIIVMSFFVKK